MHEIIRLFKEGYTPEEIVRMTPYSLDIVASSIESNARYHLNWERK